jgi:hypothetical protein
MWAMTLGSVTALEHLQYYPWMLPIYQYESDSQLFSTIQEEVIELADRTRQELLATNPPGS